MVLLYYPDELIEEVSRANDIVDIIGQYVKLKRQGNRYVGLCPFHNEKTPSFSVSADMQLYHCFGCGAGGNVFTFEMEYENYTFQEAVEHLAERAGITLPAQDSKRDRAEDDLRRQMLEANKMAARYFYYQLKSKNGQRELEYLKNRGLSDETIVKFGLGYANISSDDLYQYLKKQGFSDRVLADSGLVKVDNRGCHDRFWNRVIFPIMDVNNKVIGFGGRVMGDGLPKYLNSPETKLFDKSRNLYGLHAAKKSRRDYFLLCEGYMDVIALHQAGFTNAVASLGTAFTPQHALLLKRYVSQVILTFDSDGAGVKAALRAIPILKEAGLSVKVLNMRPHKDPDEFIKAEGAEAFEERIQEAQNSFLYEIGILRQQTDFRDPDQKTKFQQETARRLLIFEDEMERSNYIDAVADAYGLNSGELRRKVNQLGAQGYRPPSYEREQADADRVKAREKKKQVGGADKQAQRMLLAWLSKYPQAFSQVSSLLKPEDFTEPGYQKLVQMIYTRLQAGGTVNPSDLINHFIEDEQEYKMISEIFHTNLEDSKDKVQKEKIMTDLVRKVKTDSLRAAGRDASDMNAFLELVKMQEQLRGLRISL